MIQDPVVEIVEETSQQTAQTTSEVGQAVANLVDYLIANPITVCIGALCVFAFFFRRMFLTSIAARKRLGWLQLVGILPILSAIFWMVDSGNGPQRGAIVASMIGLGMLYLSEMLGNLITPGFTEFTLIPLTESSFAAVLVYEFIAAFEAEYIAALVMAE